MRTAKTPVDLTQPRPGPNSTSRSDNLLALIAGGLIGIAFAQPLGAEELVLHAKYYSSEAYSELVSYAQQLGDEEPGTGSARESPHDFSPHNFTPIGAETYSALRNFVQGRAIRAHWRERTTASLSAGQRRGLLGAA